MNNIQLDNLVVNIYNEFYEKHKELFNSNQKIYWHEASEYKEKKLMKINYEVQK